jgi:hypothetical protein
MNQFFPCRLFFITVLWPIWLRTNTFIASSDLPSWIPRVWCQCGIDVWAVSRDIHLFHVCHKEVVLLWPVSLFMFWLGSTFAWLGDWNQDRVLLNSCGLDTGGDLWVSDSSSDDHSTGTRDHGLSRVVRRLIRNSVFPSGFWFLGWSIIKTLQREKSKEFFPCSKEFFWIFNLTRYSQSTVLSLKVRCEGRRSGRTYPSDTI